MPKNLLSWVSCLNEPRASPCLHSIFRALVYKISSRFQFQPPLRFSPLLRPAGALLAAVVDADGTNSTALRDPPADLCASRALATVSRVFFNLSLYTQSGKALGSQSSVGSVVSYWLARSRSTNAISLSVREGLRSAVDCSSLLLKCVPFFLSVRNCWNFLLAPAGGEPGGEGGMSRLGTEGSVRS